MAGQPVTLIGAGDHRHNFVSEADVAAFAIAAVGAIVLLVFVRLIRRI